MSANPAAGADERQPLLPPAALVSDQEVPEVHDEENPEDLAREDPEDVKESERKRSWWTWDGSPPHRDRWQCRGEGAADDHEATAEVTMAGKKIWVRAP